METAVVAKGVLYHRCLPDAGNSLEAEWQALFQALDVAEDLAVRDLLLLGDAAEVIAKASGRLRPKGPRDEERLEQFHGAVRRFDKVRLRHVKRTQNLAGIALSKLEHEPRRTLER